MQIMRIDVEKGTANLFSQYLPHPRMDTSPGEKLGGRIVIVGRGRSLK
jgi:hypothetical protein